LLLLFGCFLECFEGQPDYVIYVSPIVAILQQIIDDYCIISETIRVVAHYLLILEYNAINPYVYIIIISICGYGEISGHLKQPQEYYEFDLNNIDQLIFQIVGQSHRSFQNQADPNALTSI